MNPDEQHLKEYREYLRKLENKEIEGISESVRLYRIDSVKNAINNVINKEKLS